MVSSKEQDLKSGATEPVPSPNTKVEGTPQAHVVKRSSYVSIGFRIVAILLVINAVLSYLVYKDSSFWGLGRLWVSKPAESSSVLQTDDILLDDEQLKAYDGSDPSKPIYVALDGTIFDVTPGARFYGPGGSYHTLAGKDAARSYITGCFEDNNPDLRGAEWTYIPKDVPGPDEPATGAQKIYREEELRKARQQVQVTLDGWKQVFGGKTGKKYSAVGKVKRAADWQSNIPLKELCERAQKKRPATRQAPRDAGAAYRQ